MNRIGRAIVAGGSRRVWLAGALLLASCADATRPLSFRDARALVSAMERWQQREPPSYELTIRIYCYCPPEVSRPVRMTVHHGKVVSRHFADDGTLHDPRYGNPPTVDELFAKILEAVNARSFVEATYDPVYGYPLNVFIDYHEQMIDDESGYVLGPLRPL